jgi:hypothetical protein
LEENTPFHSSSRSRWVAITAIMSALALVGNYVLVAIPNVELGSGVLFLTAYFFGLQMGFWCVLVVSIIYAFFNPWGPFIPTIWLAQIVGWLFMVLTGYLMRHEGSNKDWTSSAILEIAVVGAFVTLFFDLVTTLGYAIWFGIPYFIAVIAGLPFIFLHVVSNAIIFPAIVPRLDVTLKKQLDPIFSNKRSPS